MAISFQAIAENVISHTSKENKDITAHGIRAKFIADKAGKGMNAISHICGLAVKIIATGA